MYRAQSETERGVRLSEERELENSLYDRPGHVKYKVRLATELGATPTLDQTVTTLDTVHYSQSEHLTSFGTPFQQLRA